MGKITIQLLRKRSEHNEGEIHSLEELALHQEKLERIELVDKVCRNLKILLLQNNAISKIENVSRLKNLEYLNLAINLVEKIENLEGCESLRKLDLTLNFIADLTSVKTMRSLAHLEQLYLTGNPCQDYSGYRDYVVGILPQLKSLDGRDISQTERIQAIQEVENLEYSIIRQQEKYFREHQKEKKINEEASVPENVTQTESSENDISCSKTSVDDDDDSDFWNTKCADTPEVRREMIRRIEKQEEAKKPTDTKKVKVPRKLTTADGKPLNINEGKINFFLNDEWEKSQLVLELEVPKHMCTTLIDADVQPTHVKVVMKGKIFQLVLPEEVKPDSSCAQRSKTTGHLVITMPKVYDTSKLYGRVSKEPIDLRNKNGTKNSDRMHKEDISYDLSSSAKTSSKLTGSRATTVDDLDGLPPLI